MLVEWRWSCPQTRMLVSGVLVFALLWPGVWARAQVPEWAGDRVIIARQGPGEPLDLLEVAHQVARANDRLRAERLKGDELKGKIDQALSSGLPSVDLVGDWSRGRDPSFALDSTFGGSDNTFAPVPGAEPWFNDFLAQFGSFIPAPEDIPSQTFWRANLNMNWELNPSKVLGAVGAARLGLDRQSDALLAVEQGVQQDAVVAYYGIVRAAEKLAAVQARLDDQTELLDTVRLRHEIGLATALDTLQAAVGVANTKPQLAMARAGLRNSGSRLNALMGQRPEKPLKIISHIELELEPLDEGVALALAADRPELKAAAKVIDILGRNRQAQKADNRPYLSLSGSYGYVGRTSGSLFDRGHDSWRAAVAVNIPVFDGLLTHGLVKETEAQILRSRAELSAQRRDAELEILEILGNLEGAREVLAAVQLNVQQSSAVLDESLLRLKLGKAGYLDVLVAEAGVAEARSGLIEARFQVLSQTAALKRALGFSPLLPLAEIPGLVHGITDTSRGER